MKRYKSIHRYILNSKLKQLFNKIDNRTSIIDLGCPDQRHYSLYGDFKKVIISDINPNSNKVIKLDFNEKLPFNNNEFEYILATEVLEYISNQEVFISECKRILKPGGTLILSTPMFTNLHDDLIRLTERALQQYFKDFSNVNINPIGNIFSVLIDYLRREVRFLSKLIYIFQIILIFFFGKWMQKIKSNYPSGYIVIARA